MRLDVDGSNSEKVCKLATQVDMEMISVCLVSIHQNYIYFSIADSGIQRIHVEDFKLDKDFHIVKETTVSSMFFYRDTLYFEVDNFEYDSGSRATGVFKYNLKNAQIELLKENVGLYHIDSENMIFTKEEIKLFNMYSIGHFRYDNYCVIDATTETNNLKTYFIDLHGNVLDTVLESNGMNLGQGVFQGKYYVYDCTTESFYYYDISDNKLGTKKELSVK